MSQTNAKTPANHHQGLHYYGTNRNQYTAQGRGRKHAPTFEEAVRRAAARPHVSPATFPEPIRLGAPSWALPGRRVG